MGPRIVEEVELVVFVPSSVRIYPFTVFPGGMKKGLLRFRFIMSWHGGVVGGRTMCFCWLGGMRA